MSQIERYTLVLKCPDRNGILARVSGFLFDMGVTVTESHECEDAGGYFMRTEFETTASFVGDIGILTDGFEAVAEVLNIEWSIHSHAEKPRVLLAVSKFGHCLYDLLHRWRAGQLPVDIVGVFSNHDDMRSFVEWNDLPYFHLPIEKGRKSEQEGRILELVDQLNVDLVILARYMQILSSELCRALEGRCINIHHSFLPSFKGAKPYHQAHERGVKIIGATAHYVTTDLDEGPIIEQETRRIHHGYSPDRIVEAGQEVECAVLARAVRWHAENRIFLSGHRTIIFE